MYCIQVLYYIIISQVYNAKRDHRLVSKWNVSQFLNPYLDLVAKNKKKTTKKTKKPNVLKIEPGRCNKVQFFLRYSAEAAAVQVDEECLGSFHRFRPAVDKELSQKRAP